ncbi:uncharacterized protein K441DRAFT_57583 [Cenococcum geophilum 1.58]|uniref:uncharacterized protein n=1 Tax=Cenococcum geophilum 1.58 TaxID=794803 RepID=UPI00358E53DF|nr:hypothetical protein K441DRAFT_57583 [Cenococcum geophilum 1.58]
MDNIMDNNRDKTKGQVITSDVTGLVEVLVGWLVGWLVGNLCKTATGWNFFWLVIGWLPEILLNWLNSALQPGCPLISTTPPNRLLPP